MQQSLPKNLNYNDIKPIGFPSHVRIEKFTPMAFSQASTSDIIRFNINTNGFWDPYAAYIKLEVDVSNDTSGSKASTSQIFGQDVPCSGTGGAGSVQVDNSAQSFISQLLIYTKGIEIERIEDYDCIAAILNDIHYTPTQRASKYSEGVNSLNVLNGLQYSNTKNIIPIDYGGNVGNVLVGDTYGFNPNGPWGVGQFNDPASTVQTSFVNFKDAYNGQSGFMTTKHFGRYEYMVRQDGQTTVQKQSTFQHLRVTGTGDGGIGGSSILPGLGQSYVGSGDLYGSVNQYQVQGHGWQTPFCYQLSAGSGEPLLSNNFVQMTTYHGKLWNPTLINKQTFCFPLISGLLGVLMPMESYKYIPMKALQELIIEFRLNPYAMFTSGYNDVACNAFDHQPTALTNQLKRSWQITKFEINVEMQYFEPEIENIILNQLNTEKGIVLHSCSWMLGPKYSIAANSTAMGTYQVNLGFESLKNVIFFFIPDEYQQYSFCRKQYRFSENITSMYVKIGQEYYPPLPITGHGGTPGGYNSSVDIDANNSEFLIQLYKAFGKYNDITNDCFINSINFAINERAFDPTNTNAYLGAYGNDQQIIINNDTALSNPLYHENRCVGRAVYAMNLETLNQDYSVISGINTINNRPFEITIKSDSTYSYPRSRTMYVFCQYDMLIQLRTTGVQILGRG